MEEYILNYALIENGKIKIDYTYQGESIVRYFDTIDDLSNFSDLDKITDPEDLIDYFNSVL